MAGSIRRFTSVLVAVCERAVNAHLILERENAWVFGVTDEAFSYGFGHPIDTLMLVSHQLASAGKKWLAVAVKHVL